MGAAGCFTNPINRAPVTDVASDGMIPLHGQPATLTAHGYGPDDDQLTWTWAMTPYQDPCPDKSNPKNWPLGLAVPSDTLPPTSYQVPGTLTGSSWCVWAIATDRYGAAGADNYPLVPSNNPPQAMLRVVSPDAATSYPAYTHFVLGADQSSDADNDPLTCWCPAMSGSPAPAHLSASRATRRARRWLPCCCPLSTMTS